MTYQVRVNEAGELILTAEIARALGLHPGDAIAAERDGQGVKLLPTAGGVFRDEVARFIAERGDDWND